MAGRFYHVAATSASDVWAVGLQGGAIWHWNGSSWVSYSDGFGGFQGVSAQSPTDAWAVGGTSWFQPSSTNAYHWNGKTWTHVPTPTPGGSAWFNAVSATSPSNAWAVGCICGGPGALGFAVPLIEHWNGKVWQRQLFNLPQNSGQFLAVAALSASNAWAVGGTTNGVADGALIEHWNGTRWKRIWPGTGNGRGWLQGVTATGPHDIWAVGYNVPQARQPAQVPDPALERHPVEPGAQPDPYQLDQPLGRIGNLAHQRVGSRLHQPERLLLQHRRVPLERQALVGGPHPQPARQFHRRAARRCRPLAV